VSIEKKAARGVAWNMAMSVGARVIGLAGTLLLTRFIAPAEYGEVSAASISTLTASQIMFFAFGNYVIAKKSPPSVAFQAAVLHFLLGLVGIIFVLIFRAPIAAYLGAPEAGKLIPGFAVVVLLDRMRYLPERILVRELRFRAVAIMNTIGELTFTITAVGTAWKLGPYAIMAGAMARAVVNFISFMTVAPRSEWLVPSRLEKKVVKELFGYGTPIMLSSTADRAASTWDNLLMMRLFGPAVMGAYALSYSLAETPLIYVAERMSDVLMPAFAKMEAEDRPSAVVRAAGLMALVVAPLGVGLSAVAPAVVSSFFDARWSGMATILAVLSVMTIFQPSGWPALAYLQVESKTGLIAKMSFIRAAVVLSGVVVFGLLGGPIAACAGVGVGFAVHSILTVMLTARATALPIGPYFAQVIRPFFACVPMFVAVTAAHAFLGARVPAGLDLGAEVVVGGAVYIGAAFVIAGNNVSEMLRLVRGRRAAA
jgi:PST family polysaccharide transporter